MTTSPQPSPPIILANLARFGCLLTTLALALASPGCASHRPAQVLVEHQVTSLPAKGAAAAGELSLKLVTYNIWGLPSWMTGAPKGRYPKIERELERLDPDIILLQEAWTAKARKAAPANGHWAVARAAGQHTFFQQSGLVTLSRFPIIGGQFYPFSRAAFPDRFVNKGVLKVTLQLPGGWVLNVWNVHLQEGRTSEIRRSQVRELLLHVQAAEDGQIADLVGGDFNSTPESALGQELADSLGPSVQQLSGEAPFVTWDGLSAKPGRGQTIDYIFIRPRTILENLQAVPQVAFAAPSMKQRLSDHFAIEAAVSLSPATILAGATGPLLKPAGLPAVAVRRVINAGRQ